MNKYQTSGIVVVLILSMVGGVHTLYGWIDQAARVWPVQRPYEAPLKNHDVPDVFLTPNANPNANPNTNPMSPEELTRGEALLPLLEGKDEFWAMGEFVHLGEPSVPVLVKALTMPSPRIHYNAIEIISMMKGVVGVPVLLITAKELNEIPRVHEHALRVAIRLDPAKTPDAIDVMANDLNPSVRKAAAFEARHVRQKAVIPS